MATILTKGIVIRKVAHKESDCLYIIYTEKLGKVGTIVKSGKKITSKLSCHLALFSVVDLMLAIGKGYYRVASAQVSNNFFNSASQLKKSFIASYFIEALDHLTSYDSCDIKLFEISQKFLLSLNDCPSVKAGVVLLNQSLFELLTQVGYQPVVKSTNQRQLISSFNKIIVDASEKEMKSYGFLLKCFK
jgi:DNA repair protein RecO (recombination protein O)